MVLSTVNTSAASIGSNNDNQANNSCFKKRQSIDNSMIRFPKLDECAHFHYETAELENLQVSLINNESYKTRLINTTHDDNGGGHGLTDIQNVNIFVRIHCSNRSWTVRRDLRDFSFLDTQLHKCVFDRQHSQLEKLDVKWFTSVKTLDSISYHIDQYLRRLSMIVGTSLTCGPILHWFEMDNHGNRLINEESDINTPAIGAAFVIKKHCKKDLETEISLDIGELISVIEMPPLNESFYWKGKKGFEVGFFPAECVQLIDDKISRKSEELPLRPLKKCISPTPCYRNNDLSVSLSDSDDHADGSVEAAAVRKRSKISALFRNFVAGIHTRRRIQLKRSGILKERVFGADLCEHLGNCGHDCPLVLTACCSYIEANGLNTNGIYRISGVVSTVNRLRSIFDEDRIPNELINNEPLKADDQPLDIHAVSSVLKQYFRELPNPIMTFSLFDSFITTMRDNSLKEDERVKNIKKLIQRLPPPHWRTLRLLIRHLALISRFHSNTGMTAKNLAIVWAPNLLRAKTLDLGKEALQIVATQALLTEFLIANCDKIFDQEEFEIHPSKSLYSSFVHSKESNKSGSPPLSSKCLKYIDVGPEIVPGKYHTIISCRPSQSKRSKFNLQNFKFHNFFTAKNSMGARHRPSLSVIQNNNESDNNNHKRSLKDQCRDPYYHDRGDNITTLIQSQSVKYTTSFQASKILCCSNKQVKRSESFESYFKKMKTSNSVSNRQPRFATNHLHNGNDDNDDDCNYYYYKNGSALVDIESINSKKEIIPIESKNSDQLTNNHMGTAETIFEVEKESDDYETNNENFPPPSNPQISSTYDTVEMVSDDDIEFQNHHNHNKQYIAENEKRLDPPKLGEVSPSSSSSSSSSPVSIFDLYPHHNTSISEDTSNLKAIENLPKYENINNTYIDGKEKILGQWGKPTTEIKKSIGIHFVNDSDEHCLERRKRIQQQQQVLGNLLNVVQKYNSNAEATDNEITNKNDHLSTRHYNSVQKLNPKLPESTMEYGNNPNGGEKHKSRAKLGRSMPVMEFDLSTTIKVCEKINENDPGGTLNDDDDDDDDNNNNNNNINNTRQPSPCHLHSQTLITKMTITPLRTVNKRQRIIYDKNELSSFFEK